jgi:hypothetical protein
MLPALKDGVRDALAHWPSALLLFAAVATPAGLVGYVFQTGFVGAFGKSAALETLSNGFVYTTLFDLFTKEGFRLLPVLAVSLAVLVINLPLHSFLTAGLISALKERGAWSSSAYFAGAARYTGRFLSLSLLTIGVVLPIATLTITGAGVLFVETENPSNPGVLGFLVVGVVMSACVLTLSDYARIFLVQEPEQGVFGSIRAAMEFLVKHAGRAAALTLSLAVASLAPLAGVVFFEEMVPLAVGGWLVPLVLVQQAAVMLRSWVRVLAFATQSSFIRTSRGALRPGEDPSTPSPFLAQGI